MSLKRIRKSNSVIYRWAMSYVSVIVIALFVMLMMYGLTIGAIEQEVVNSNNLVLEKVRDNVDNILKEAERFSIEISSIEGLTELLGPIRPTDTELRYSLMQAVKALNKFVALNGDLENMYIYLDYADSVLTPGIIYTDKNYFDMYLRHDGYEYADWKAEMQLTYSGSYTKMVYQDDVSGRQERPCFIRSVPLSTFGRATANAVIFLDFDRLLSLNGDSGDRQREILLIDKEDNIIYGNTKDLPEIKYNELTFGTGNIDKKINGQDYIISSASSDVTNWKYAIVTPEDVFMQKTNSIWSVMLYGIIICVLLELIISFFFIKRNYTPLNELVSYLKGRMQMGTQEDKDDEFTFLRQSVLEMFEKTESFSTKLEKQSALMGANFIVSLLKDKDKDMIVPPEELLETYNIRFPYERYAVMLIYIESVDEDFWKQDYEKELDVYELVKLVISNVVEELINRENSGYMVFSDGMFLCVCNTPFDGGDFTGKMLEITGEASDFIKEQFKIEVKFAFGGLYESLDKMSMSYSQAVRAMEFLRVSRLKDAAFYDSISSESLRSMYKIRDAIYKVVKDYYSDQNLCISFIAGEIDKHPNYISRVFKEQTGEGIGEYINRVRVEKAKELIVQGKLTPEEIAKKVGYSNLRTFYRAFKKIEGVTPGKYK